MPVAKIHLNEGVYAQSRIQKISNAVQSALLEVLKIPPDDFFQIIHELPKSHFLHTPSFLGLTYSDEFILLEVTFLAGRSRETRLALLNELNQRVAAQAGISKDDLLIMLYEIPGENASFGRGLAQRASISAAAQCPPGAPAFVRRTGFRGKNGRLTARPLKRAHPFWATIERRRAD